MTVIPPRASTALAVSSARKEIATRLKLARSQIEENRVRGLNGTQKISSADFNQLLGLASGLTQAINIIDDSLAWTRHET